MTDAMVPNDAHQIDEPTAWSLLRRVRARDGAQDPRRVHHDARSNVWLQVYSSGAWETSHRPTDTAAQLLDLYLPLTLPAELVIAQTGQSLDGRIATVDGHSHYITGPEDIRHLHRLRALVDAVVVGATTVEADDPRLTVRLVPGPNPTRVVIDPRQRIDRRRHVFSDGAAPTLTIARTMHDGTPETADRIDCPADTTGLLAPGTIVESLRRRGYRRLLVEGGGRTVSRFLDAGVLDRLHVTVAPMVLGSGHAAFTLDPIRHLDDAIRPASRLFRLGDDVLFDLDLSGHGRRGLGR